MERLNLTDITYNKARHEIRCAREEGRNPSSVKVDTNTLYYYCFSTGHKGSIYSLIMERLHKNFPQALNWTANVLDLNHEEFDLQLILPFGGYYKNILKAKSEPEACLPTYDESMLDAYENGGSLMFLKDGISCETQTKFKVGYDPESMRITIPQWSLNGELIGVMGRLNSTTCSTDQRWLPIIPCSRSLTLYGYHINYSAIQQERTCLILEAEKSVMQLDSMGYNYGLALGTNLISETQVKYIKALMVENIIIGLDEGVSEEHIIQTAEKLRLCNPFFKNNIGYIYDNDNSVLPKGSKASPTDLGIDALKKLMKEKIRWLRG